jgi:hypothetical protein
MGNIGVARLRCWLGAVASLALMGLCSPVSADDEVDVVNDGQDVTNPIQRIDLRLGYANLPNGLDTGTFILRYDKPFTLEDGWKLGLRFDFPLVRNDVPSLDNLNGEYEAGYGDTLFQFIFSKVLDQRSAFGLGAQLIAPTATQDQFGSGHWRVVPTIGYRYGLPEISPGSFFLAAVRYDRDFAGDNDRPDVNNLQFSPTLNIALPNTSFLTLFPSSDIRYNFEAKDWFVPFNAQVGRVWDGKMVTSLEFGVPLYRGDAPLYDFKIEARVGFFF